MNKQLLHRLRPWLIGAATLVLSTLPHAAFAASPTIHTVLDGHDLTFNTPPIIENNRTMVPARQLLESLGAQVVWDPVGRSVTAALGPNKVAVYIGSTTAYVNGDRVTLATEPEIVNGSTLVPLRFFAEDLGMGVSWDGDTRTIYIDSRHASTVSRSGSTVNRVADRAAMLARNEVGAPYAWGGTTTAGFDCSGLVYWVGQQIGVDLPRTSYEQFDEGAAVTRANLAPGDLVFFSTYADGASHVGIYVGDGQFVNAESSDTGVKLTAMSNPYWSARYVGARRVFR